MINSKADLVQYRLARARETFEDAQLLAQHQKWNSSINRLYYSAYYGVSALLLNEELNVNTHNGVKAKFSEQFILTNKIPKKYGKIYSQLFTWRQKGDYDDMFDFDSEKVEPYFVPIEELINLIEELVKL